MSLRLRLGGVLSWHSCSLLFRKAWVRVLELIFMSLMLIVLLGVLELVLQIFRDLFPSILGSITSLFLSWSGETWSQPASSLLLLLSPLLGLPLLVLRVSHEIRLLIVFLGKSLLFHLFDLLRSLLIVFPEAIFIITHWFRLRILFFGG